MDTRSTGAVLARIGQDLDADQFGELVSRLGVIYDEVVPAPKKGGTDGS